MKKQSDHFSKLLLFLSVILGIAFLVMLFLVVSQLNDSWGRGNEREDRPFVINDEERYGLRQNATPYQIELFEQLIAAHDEFEQWGSDETLEAYAAAIVQNFVADFYTLSNKIDRNDVGGIQFFSEEIASVFTNHAIDNFYLHLNHHIETFGMEALPTVALVNITHITFDYRPIELENDNGNEENQDGVYGFPSEPTTQYERVVIVDATWTYETSTLSEIHEFQTSARFTLRITEEGVHIYIIEETSPLLPYGS